MDGKDWQKDDFDGGIKWWDKKDKDWKDKPEKLEKNEKIEKPEKPEIKELKLEKIESDGVFDPRRPPRPDPRLDQVIRALAGLTEKVEPARRPGRGTEEAQGLNGRGSGGTPLGGRITGSNWGSGHDRAVMSGAPELCSGRRNQVESARMCRGEKLGRPQESEGR